MAKTDTLTYKPTLPKHDTGMEVFTHESAVERGLY